MNQTKTFTRARQKTGSYCGPAVMQTLASALGISVDQDALVDASGARKTVMKHGIPISDLAKGLRKLSPKLRLWLKHDGSLDDLKLLLAKGYLPGVDWQGMFSSDEYGDDEVDRFEDFWDKVTKAPVAEGEQGHYCVVLEVNEKQGYLRFADPYGHYAGKDRFIAIWEFEERWWDDKIERDEKGKKKYVLENRLLFVLTTKGDTYPKTLGMKILT